MPIVSVDDPKEVDIKDVDGEGRLYLGKEYRNTRISFIIEEIVEDKKEDNNE